MQAIMKIRFIMIGSDGSWLFFFFVFAGVTYQVVGCNAFLDSYFYAVAHAYFDGLAAELLLRYTVGQDVNKVLSSLNSTQPSGMESTCLARSSTISPLAE